MNKNTLILVLMVNFYNSLCKMRLKNGKEAYARRRVGVSWRVEHIASLRRRMAVP